MISCFAMPLVAKLTISAITTIVGGGTVWAVFSKSHTNTIPSRQKESELGLGKREAELLLTNPNHSDSSLQLPERLDSPQVSSKELVHSHSSTREVLETQNLKGEGNCEVTEDSKNVIKHLPKESKYVVVLCKNSGGIESFLKSWRGFLPEKILNENFNSFISGRKFEINVEERNDSSDFLSGDPYKTIFSSKQFSTNSVTGNWGVNIISDFEGDEPIYKVELKDDSNTVKEFYLQWLM